MKVGLPFVRAACLPVCASLFVAVSSIAASNELFLETVVFDLDYVSGAGGFTYPEYEPVYLLGDGRACRCTDIAVEDLNEAVLAKAEPSRMGEWRRSGAGFIIQYRDGSEPEEVKGTLARPLELPANTTLIGTYRSIGGGGNIALGGGTMTAHVEDLTFFADGSFSQSDFRYADAPPGGAYSTRGMAGTYRLDGPTLTLAYRDGRTVRTSAFYSSERKDDADFGKLGVLWIGGEGFKRKE